MTQQTCPHPCTCWALALPANGDQMPAWEAHHGPRLRQCLSCEAIGEYPPVGGVVRWLSEDHAAAHRALAAMWNQTLGGMTVSQMLDALKRGDRPPGTCQVCGEEYRVASGGLIPRHGPKDNTRLICAGSLLPSMEMIAEKNSPSASVAGGS